MNSLQLEKPMLPVHFPGGGEMGELMRAKSWANTALGPVERWPQSLKTATALMLESGFAMLVAWGADYRFLYNDRFRPILGNKHPDSLGAPAREIFPELWETIEPLFMRTRRGEAVAVDDLLAPLNRHGYLENCYFTFSYSPIRDESGGVGGMLGVVAETTERVEGERRLGTLRDLARRATDAKTPAEACVNAAAVFGDNPIDVPFALIYLLDDDGGAVRRVASVGVEPGHTAAPESMILSPRDDSPWPLREAARGKVRVVDDVTARFGMLASGPFPEPVHTALVLPLTRPGLAQPYGFLLAGVSARRALNERYRDFFELAAEHLTTAIANARSLEEERRRADALAEIDRAKTAFFSNVSHEFRTPLTLMLGPLEQAMREGAGPRESLDVAHRNSLRLLKLVNSLLDFARIEAGRVEASYEPTDLPAFTAELASVFRSTIEKAGLRLVIDCPPLAEPVYVDRDLWEKIVFNLLSNAFKFTFEGEIDVSVRRVSALAAGAPSRDHVQLVVRDTGIGISAAALPRIFERFHRIRNVRARSHEGSGIGLALVQELARLHGGNVAVDSVEGAGTTFTVSIPVGTAHLPPERIGTARRLESTTTSALSFVEEVRQWLPHESTETPSVFSVRASDGAATETSAAPAAAAPAVSLSGANSEATPAGVARSRGRILLADDNRDMRDYVRRLLVEAGYDVIAANDGEAALEMTRRNPPDLILSDVMMPRLDGFGLLQALRSDAATQTIPLILVSARAGEGARVEGVEAGADDYLTKPFSARELLARVETHLDLARLRREAEGAVKRERQRLHELLMTAPAMICVLRGPQHVFELANAPYLTLVGRSEPQAILGRPVRAALPELEGQGYFEILDKVFETGEPFVGREMKVQLQRRGGGPDDVYVNFVYQPTHDAAGRIDGILVHATDVTEQVRARHRVEDLAARLAAEGERSRASEQHLRALVETTPECVKIVARDGTLLHMNPSGLALIEADPGDLVVGKCVYDLIAPEDRERFRQFNERVCQGEKATLEFELIGLRGTRRHMETHAAPFLDADGAMVQLGLTRDVTEHKAAEDALRESELRFRAFVTASSDVVYRMNPDWTEMRLLDGKDFIADTRQPAEAWLERYIHPDDQPRVLEAIREAVRNKSAFELEHRVVRADGTPGWTVSRAVPLLGAHGQIVEWFGAARDVTERKRAQEAIEGLTARAERERRLYQTVLSSTPDLVYVFGLDHRFTYANDALLKMWGRTSDEALGRTCLELGYEPWHAAMHDREIEQVVATKRPIRGEVPFDGTNGRRIYDYIFVPVLGADGEVEAVAGTTRDVTEMVKARETVAERRKELEHLVDERTAKLRQAVEQMEEFSYSVSHDLRSPARAMCGYAEVILQEYGDRLDAQGREMLARIQRSSGRMDRLIQDLLTYSRISRREVQLDPVSPERLLQEVILQYPELAPQRADIEVAGQLPEVIAHEPSLTQALSNLLSNAVKFVAPGVRPRVVVRAERRESRVRLWIEDNGIGIPPGQQRRLFGMFERMHPDRGYEGTGIGLAIVRKAVERMNGTVGVESDGESGSRFWIELPTPAETKR